MVLGNSFQKDIRRLKKETGTNVIQESVIESLLFLIYVNSQKRLFTDDRMVHRKIDGNRR